MKRMSTEQVLTSKGFRLSRTPLSGCENRRRLRRINIQVPIRYQVGGGDSRPTATVSMTATGARLVLDRGVACGQYLQLTFPLSEAGYRLGVRARVVWQQAITANKVVAGVVFPSMPLEDQFVLSSLLRSLEPTGTDALEERGARRPA